MTVAEDLGLVLWVAIPLADIPQADTAQTLEARLAGAPQATALVGLAAAHGHSHEAVPAALCPPHAGSAPLALVFL